MIALTMGPLGPIFIFILHKNIAIFFLVVYISLIESQPSNQGLHDGDQKCPLL